MYESVNDREIHQVFEGQNQIHLEIKQLHRQLAMILDEQNRYVSVVTDELSKRQVELVGQVGSLIVRSCAQTFTLCTQLQLPTALTDALHQGGKVSFISTIADYTTNLRRLLCFVHLNIAINFARLELK